MVSQSACEGNPWASERIVDIDSVFVPPPARMQKLSRACVPEWDFAPRCFRARHPEQTELLFGTVGANDALDKQKISSEFVPNNFRAKKEGTSRKKNRLEGRQRPLPNNCLVGMMLTRGYVYLRYLGIRYKYIFKLHQFPEPLQKGQTAVQHGSKISGMLGLEHLGVLRPPTQTCAWSAHNPDHPFAPKELHVCDERGIFKPTEP
ncbi:hypothetical protein llap_9108 [Limosa lapponica baueri]|uniref:Uncharacterized protein n=1 Tax=Limosa lapponica baueri TaxID=1758121 RepID=A0A2I0U3I1_LIMLA|nr:hypothetical protein llap_9108 [Limosa lapponica baueri]